jgi:hypothetical protein
MLSLISMSWLLDKGALKSYYCATKDLFLQEMQPLNGSFICSNRASHAFLIDCPPKKQQWTHFAAS